MKIRRDFVTNSSSSSYVCVARVDLCDELREYMKESSASSDYGSLMRTSRPEHKSKQKSTTKSRMSLSFSTS